MITDTFENLSEEIIKVNHNPNAVRVDACILTFSHMVLKYVLDNFECRKIGDLFSSNGANPVYGIKMLLYQGAESFEIWTGRDAPVDVMEKALKDTLNLE